MNKKIIKEDCEKIYNEITCDYTTQEKIMLGLRIIKESIFDIPFYEIDIEEDDEKTLKAIIKNVEKIEKLIDEK